ncbi:MAG TPA: hypothetical protein VJ022_03425, partial [Anaerolineales bacterium]|nr:hypothetical protein [Anaerolineales bacterium]
FNFGTVYITVGGQKLAFEDVIDPASVQSDIDRRRMARQLKKTEGIVAAERERMAEWLVTYHNNAEELREEERKRAFIPIIERIDLLPDSKDKPAAKKAIQDFVKEDAKGDKADEEIVKKLLNLLSEIVPDVVGAIWGLPAGILSRVSIFALKELMGKKIKKEAA